MNRSNSSSLKEELHSRVPAGRAPKMLYPIELIYDVKVVDGGFFQFFVDNVVLFVKVSVIAFAVWLMLYCAAWVWADFAVKHLTPSCISELAHLAS